MIRRVAAAEPTGSAAARGQPRWRELKRRPATDGDRPPRLRPRCRSERRFFSGPGGRGAPGVCAAGGADPDVSNVVGTATTDETRWASAGGGVETSSCAGSFVVETVRDGSSWVFGMVSCPFGGQGTATPRDGSERETKAVPSRAERSVPRVERVLVWPPNRGRKRLVIPPLSGRTTPPQPRTAERFAKAKRTHVPCA